MNRPSVLFAFIASLLVILSGCSDEPGGVGKGLLTARDTLHLETRVFTATSDTNFLTRINGNSGRVLTGLYQDLEARTLVEFSAIPVFNPGVIIDSAVVTLGIEYRFRDSTGEFGLTAHKMIRTWDAKSFTWDSLPGASDDASSGSFLATIAGSDTAISFHLDTAVVRLWSQTASGSLLLTPSLTAQLVLGFSNTVSPAGTDLRPLLTVSYRDVADTTVKFSARASRSIFVANATLPALAGRTVVQAGVDYPALVRFDSLAIPPKVAIIQASLEFAADEGSSFLNPYSRDSLIVYLTRKSVYPYDSLILGVDCGPERIGLQKYYRADVKNIVQQWISREPNRALAVHSFAEFTSLDRFVLYGADAAAALRPKLTVTYTLFP